MKYPKIVFSIIVFCIAIPLNSCSFTTLPHDVKTTMNKTESDIAEANNKIKNAKNIENNNFITHTNTGYFGNQSIAQYDKDFLPPLFSNPIQIDKQFNGIQSIATSINELTRIPTIIDLSSSFGNNSCSNVRITQQEGNLIDLLDLITARCDIAWSYRDGKIILSDTETRLWTIKGIPGDIQVQNQVANNSGVQSQSGSSGSSSGGGGQSTAQSNQVASQNIAFNLQNSLWQNIQDSVKSMLSSSGKFNISPSTSSLTATDRPSVLLRVDSFIKAQNEIMKRQVQIDVQILNVDVEAEDNYGINWNLALKGTNASFFINGQAVSQGNNGSAPSGPTQVFVPTSVTQAFTIGANTGDLSGSQLIMNALSTITKTSLVTTAAVTTLSNQPVPVQFVDQLSYLASVQTTVTGAASTSQTALTPGELTTGFSLNVLPVIQSDGNVFLQLSLNISALKKMSQYTSGGSTIQLPETLERNLMQKAVVRNGDTFVVTGFDSDASAISNTGVGGAYNWILGGGVSANKNRTKMVILITPRVVNL